jgi:hypothetical protein
MTYYLTSFYVRFSGANGTRQSHSGIECSQCDVYLELSEMPEAQAWHRIFCRRHTHGPFGGDLQTCRGLTSLIAAS